MRLGSLVAWASANGLTIGAVKPVPRDQMEAMLARVAKAANLRGYVLDLLSEDKRTAEGVHVIIKVDIA